MHAAVVSDFDRAPAYAPFPDPAPADGVPVLDVVASAIHPRVRSQADGSHYTSTGVLPLVPGVDGVARTPDGALRYFVAEGGAMAERAVVDPRRSVALPDGVDPVLIAAAMNPAMSSWIALTRRVRLAPGVAVIVLGATGTAGRLAVQIAKRLGAGRVTAAGRDPRRLAAAAVGADALVRLDGEPDAVARELAAAGREADVVLDYLWGDVTAAALRAIVPARADGSRTLTWIELGSMAGLECPVPSAALRATRLQLIGSGQGAVAPREILAELPGLAAELTGGGYTIGVRRAPLADVEAQWAAAATADERIVLEPGPAVR